MNTELRHADASLREELRESVDRLDAETFPTLGQIHDFDRVGEYGDEQFLLGLRLLIRGIASTIGNPITDDAHDPSAPQPAREGRRKPLRHG